MTEKEFAALIDRYIRGTASEQETAQLDSWYLKQAAAQMDNVYDHDLQSKMDKALPLILANKQVHPKQVVISKRMWSKWVAAAAVVLMVFAGGYFYEQFRRNTNSILMANDIAPGKNGATLTLADGKKISIAALRSGEVIEQSGVRIAKAADGQLIYEVLDKGAGKLGYHTLETTRGEQTQVRLPDGSVVFLNAESALRYPASFASQTKREVSLVGEGYFEIAKDQQHPFVVATKGQQVEVLGTHFNINSYQDEIGVRTTLLEGSVRVSPSGEGILGKGVVLKPMQQAALVEKQLTIAEVNAEEVIAWKNGLFVYDDETLESIMRKVERWYDVKVVFEEGVDRDRKFYGSVSRYDKVSKLLEGLQLTKVVHFKVEGRQITVRN